MSFYEDVGKEYDSSKKKVDKNLEDYRKQREAIEDKSEIKDIRTQMKIHYKEQMKLPVEEREIYTDELDIHVIFYITEDKIRKNEKGESLNLPYIAKGGKLRFRANFPLMHDNEDIYFKMVTVLCDPDDFGYKAQRDIGKMLKKNLGVIARGNIQEQYKPIDKSYTKKEAMKDFEYLKWYNGENEKQVEAFKEIDSTEYRVNYTFWQTQILEMKVLK